MFKKKHKTSDYMNSLRSSFAQLMLSWPNNLSVPWDNFSQLQSLARVQVRVQVRLEAHFCKK